MEKLNVEIKMVNGNEYEVWANLILRGMFAKNIKTGETKQISFFGYMKKDLTIRKAVADVFHEPTFRTK